MRASAVIGQLRSTGLTRGCVPWNRIRNSNACTRRHCFCRKAQEPGAGMGDLRRSDTPSRRRPGARLLSGHILRCWHHAGRVPSACSGRSQSATDSPDNPRQGSRLGSGYMPGLGRVLSRTYPSMCFFVNAPGAGLGSWHLGDDPQVDLRIPSRCDLRRAALAPMRGNPIGSRARAGRLPARPRSVRRAGIGTASRQAALRAPPASVGRRASAPSSRTTHPR